MEACPALQASAVLHSEFMRTLVGDRLTAVEQEAEVGSSTLLRSAQDETSWANAGEGEIQASLAALSMTAKNRLSMTAKSINSKSKTFERHSDLMIQDCASSRLCVAENAAERAKLPNR